MQRLRRILSDLFWLAVAVAIVVGGVIGFRLMGEAAPVVEAEAIARPIASVDSAPLAPLTDPLPIRGTGFIEPFRMLTLSAEQSGRIVELHPALDTRGRFSSGDILVQLDDSTVQASLAQAAANIASTQARLALTATQLERTQTLFDRGIVSQEALDQVQTEFAELQASLISLEAARDSAQIAVENTRIRAPFDGSVIDKEAELGAFVGAGQAIATLYTSDLLEVTIPIREASAALIPGLFTGAAQPARVMAEFAGQDLIWPAEVARVDPALDAATRTLNVTVRLTGPAEADGAAPSSGIAPALINAHTRVVIEGAQIEDVFAMPSTALHENGTAVYLVADGALMVHAAEVIHVDGENSFVRLQNIPLEARLIVSPLDAPIDGMPVQDLGQESRHETASLGGYDP